MVYGSGVCVLTQEVGDMPQKQILKNHAFTHGLNDAQIDHLADIATPVAFEDDEVVLVDGARSTSFFLLLTGSVAAELLTPRYAVRAQASGPGDVFRRPPSPDGHA